MEATRKKSADGLSVADFMLYMYLKRLKRDIWTGTPAAKISLVFRILYLKTVIGLVDQRLTSRAS